MKTHRKKQRRIKQKEEEEEKNIWTEKKEHIIQCFNSRLKWMHKITERNFYIFFSSYSTSMRIVVFYFV